MASSWPIVSIDDIKASSKASIAIGPFGSRLKADSYIPSGVPVIRGNNLNGARFLTNEFVYVSDEKANELTSSNVYADDLVFPHRGNIGSVGLVPDDLPRYLLSTSLMKLTVNKGLVDPTFLFYYFTSEIGKHELLKNASQAGTPGIATPLSSLKSIKFQLPPLDEQRRIAHILGTLDDKIELNRQLNATLEQLARTLFQSWFVDFDPVRAKASGEPEESICRRLGLTPELLALFPAALEDSTMGEVPAGWTASSVDEEFNLIMGQSPPGDTYNSMSDGLPFYQGRTDFGFRFPTHRIYCTAPTRFASIGDTLISVRAPVGDINMANERCAIGRGVAAARHKSGSRIYTYEMMRNLKPKFDSFNGEGTVFGSINKKAFHDMKCIAPDQSSIEAFDKMLAAVEISVENNELESRTLAALRDELLPKLLSGDLRLN